MFLSPAWSIFLVQMLFYKQIRCTFTRATLKTSFRTWHLLTFAVDFWPWSMHFHIEQLIIFSVNTIYLPHSISAQKFEHFLQRFRCKRKSAMTPTWKLATLPRPCQHPAQADVIWVTLLYPLLMSAYTKFTVGQWHIKSYWPTSDCV